MRAGQRLIITYIHPLHALSYNTLHASACNRLERKANREGERGSKRAGDQEAMNGRRGTVRSRGTCVARVYCSILSVSRYRVASCLIAILSFSFSLSLSLRHQLSHSASEIIPTSPSAAAAGVHRRRQQRTSLSHIISRSESIFADAGNVVRVTLKIDDMEAHTRFTNDADSALDCVFNLRTLK